MNQKMSYQTLSLLQSCVLKIAEQPWSYQVDSLPNDVRMEIYANHSNIRLLKMSAGVQSREYIQTAKRSLTLSVNYDLVKNPGWRHLMYRYVRIKQPQ